MPRCKTIDPPLLEVRPNRRVACHLYYDVAQEAQEAQAV
jgi:hypothetical protein